MRLIKGSYKRERRQYILSFLDAGVRYILKSKQKRAHKVGRLKKKVHAFISVRVHCPVTTSCTIYLT